MQFSFLGKSYTPSTPAIQTIESQQQVCFMGRCSLVKQHSIAQRQALGEELIFMGRRYTR
jgi:hypothetical protein